MKKNKCVCLFVCMGSKKHFLYFFTLAFNVEKTWSWSGSKVKKHCFLPGSKVKKTFSIVFYFRIDQSKTMVLVKIKSQKYIVSFRFQRSKKHFLRFFYFRAHKFDERFLGLRNRNLSVVFLKSFSLTFIASKGLFLKVRYVPERTRMKLYFCHTRIVLSEKLFHNNRQFNAETCKCRRR